MSPPSSPVFKAMILVAEQGRGPRLFSFHHIIILYRMP